MKYNHNLKRCMTCIMPESPGHISFNAAGECSLCSQFREIAKDQQTFDCLSENVKINILRKKVERFKKGDKYDCAVSVSGGKDSIMTLYIAVKQLGLKPLAIFIDNGFSLDEMYENVRNATDILGTDLVMFKTSEMLRLFPHLLRSKKSFYYCRICHALLDDSILSICKKNNIHLVMGGYTKGQQYIRN